MSETLETRGDLFDAISRWAETPPLSLALVDIDGFQAINDTFGRAVGDRVLKRVAAVLREVPTAVVTRTGGDEFACALPSATPEHALLAMEAARIELEGMPLSAGGDEVAIRISSGVASLPQHAEDPGELFQAADAALLRAKTEGRNRVAIYVEDKMVLKSNYYPRAQLARLSTLAARTDATEASLLREALGDLLTKYAQDT